MTNTKNELEPTPHLVKIMRQVERDIQAKKTPRSVTSTKKILAHLDSL